MHILLSNDDGFYAKGLKLLYHSLSKNHQITIVAPDRNCSGASSSLTLNLPIHLKKIKPNQYLIQGTPTDCIHMALTGLMKKKPDMVIAGINFGSNLGDDTLYSGTLAAAIEGRCLGTVSIAISLAVEPDYKEVYFATAIHFFKIILAKIIASDNFFQAKVSESAKKTSSIFSINVPNVPVKEIKGIQITRLGSRQKAKNIIETQDPRCRKNYWIGTAGESDDNAKGTDFYAVENNYISITPIHTDLTAYSEINRIKEVFELKSFV